MATLPGGKFTATSALATIESTLPKRTRKSQKRRYNVDQVHGNFTSHGHDRVYTAKENEKSELVVWGVEYVNGIVQGKTPGIERPYWIKWMHEDVEARVLGGDMGPTGSSLSCQCQPEDREGVPEEIPHHPH